MIIPVAEKFGNYAKEVFNELLAAEIRVKLDLSEDRMNAKIRIAQNEKIPYMLIVGEKEEESKKKGGLVISQSLSSPRTL